MRVPTALTRLGPAQALLRVAVVVLTLLALCASWPDLPDPWLLVAVGGLAAGAAVRPDSPAGAVAGVSVLGWWGLAVPDPGGPGLLVAALALLGAHLAATLAAYGPVGLRVDGPLLRRWLLRLAACAAVTVVVWAAVQVLEDRPAPAAAWPVGVLLALASTIGAGIALRRLDGRAEGRPAQREAR